MCPGICTYEEPGHTLYQVMSNTWYKVYLVPGKSGDRVLGGGLPVTVYQGVPGKSGDQVLGVPK